MPPERNISHKWTFPARFRAGAYGWKSQTPIKRIKEAVSEIKKVASTDPATAAEGAVRFLERISPAIEHADSSSGAIGGAANAAIDALAPIVVQAEVDAAIRDDWLERLWTAIQEDQMPYIELLPEFWGEFCVTRERASRWADSFLPAWRMSYSADSLPGAYFSGRSACLGALLTAERYEELTVLVATMKHQY